jgi:large repetitive protein
LSANAATLVVSNDVTGNGTATIAGTNAVLEFGAASNQNTTFAAGAQGTLKLDDASNYAGTVAGFVVGNTIDLANFKFSDNPIVTGLTGTGVVGTTTDVTVHDGIQSVILHLVNQTMNEFVNDPAAYVLAQDNTVHHGTLFELHV